MSKLSTLADQEGFDSIEELVEEYYLDSVVPGICMNPGCNYCGDVEPDQDHGHCEFCGTQSVRSALSLAGMI